jgi:hypothetical protein
MYGASLFNGPPLVIERQDGERLYLTGTEPDHERIARRIYDETMPHLIDRAWQALDRGAEVLFGVLSVDRKGVCNGGSFLPWRDVVVRQEEGWIVLYDQDDRNPWRRPWYLIAKWKLPNAMLFLELAREIQRTL